MKNVRRISNLNFFNEVTPDIEEIVTEVEKTIDARIDKRAYESSCKKIITNPVFNLQALFAPFNELNKAFYAFIPYLKNKLKNGDAILDFESGSGWSIAMLSAFFPEQKIKCVCYEDDINVHSYSRFAYWFGNEHSNIEIFFCKKSEPLPVSDTSIAFVYGLDLLHSRLKTDPINELLRVVNNEAFVLLPHIDLSKALGKNYFNDGSGITHVLDYEKLFGDKKSKKSYTFSVRELFRASYDKSYRAKANQGTLNFDELVVIANNGDELEKKISAFNYFEHFALDKAYLLHNPVFELNVNNSIKIRTSQIEAPLAQLLEQHPVYVERIKKTVGYTLNDEERIVLYWAKKCRSCSFIQHQLQIESYRLQQIIEKLATLDILQIMPLDPKHVRMQHYIAYQEFIEAPEDFNLRNLWNQTVASYPDKTYALDRTDSSFYTYREFDEIVKCITSTLIQNNIGKGDKILLHAITNFETIGLFWACMQLGIVFVPVSPSLPEPLIEGLIEQHKPRIILLAHYSAYYKKWRDKIVLLDNDNETDDHPRGDNVYFSEWLKENREIENLPKIDENDMCMIIPTSGSTGVPKGVKLTHGQLWQGAINAIRPYLINEKNNCLSVTGLDAIGGFRGLCFSTIVGGTCIIPTPSERTNPAELLECIYETETHYISISPSLLNQLLSKKDVKARLAKMQCIMSAGSALTTELKTNFFEKTNKIIHNIYGMTEAAGVLICEPLNTTNLKGGVIGSPVDCIIKVVDEHNIQVKAGQAGELLLYGYAVFKGYYTSDEPFPNEIQQWYATGDLVRLNPDGSIEITGRKKDFMKNSRGEIVYFSEIENALAPLRFIEDLGIVAFFSNESERGALFVVLNEAVLIPENVVEEIKKQITNTIGHNKIPSVIKIIDKIPRAKNGKLLKNELSSYL